MTELLELIKGRRSVRTFLEKDIQVEVLDRVLQAVQWSQSWANTQCWEIVIVRDQAAKEQLSATVFPKNPASKAVATAPVVLAVCGKQSSAGFYNGQAVTKHGDWFMFDLGIAVQSLSLYTQAEGLGNVVVGAFDHGKAAEILKVPAGVELAVLIPLGYPAKVPSNAKRKEMSEFVHQETF